MYQRKTRFGLPWAYDLKQIWGLWDEWKGKRVDQVGGYYDSLVYYDSHDYKLDLRVELEMVYELLKEFKPKFLNNFNMICSESRT